MKNKMIAIIIFMLVFAVMFTGCTNQLPKGQNDDGPEYTPPDDPPYVPDPDPPEPRYDDSAFISWLHEANNDLLWYSGKVSDSLNTKNYVSLEYWAEAKEDIIDDTYSPECEEFYLSWEYDRIRDEYSEYLSDCSWACFYIKWAGKEMQSGSYTSATDSFNDATSYTRKATAHLNTVTDLINAFG